MKALPTIHLHIDQHRDAVACTAYLPKAICPLRVYGVILQPLAKVIALAVKT